MGWDDIGAESHDIPMHAGSGGSLGINVSGEPRVTERSEATVPLHGTDSQYLRGTMILHPPYCYRVLLDDSSTESKD